MDLRDTEADAHRTHWVGPTQGRVDADQRGVLGELESSSDTVGARAHGPVWSADRVSQRLKRGSACATATMVGQEDPDDAAGDRPAVFTKLPRVDTAEQRIRLLEKLLERERVRAGAASGMDVRAEVPGSGGGGKIDVPGMEVDPPDSSIPGVPERTCLQYKTYAWLPAPDLCAPKLGHGNYNEDIRLCLGAAETGAAAVAWLHNTYGTGAQERLWESIFQCGFLDDTSRRPADFDSQLWKDGWDESLSHMHSAQFRFVWGATDSMHGVAPRREVMRWALWLIQALHKGVPQRFEDWDVFRDVVVPIRDGEMRYYVAKGGILCHGWDEMRCIQVPSLAAATGEPCGVQAEGTDCLFDHELVLVGELHFKFDQVAPDFGEGSHHGGHTGSRKVSLCMGALDRSTVMFDWYVTLAVSHLAHAEHFARSAPQTAAYHEVAVNILLRMALGAASAVAQTILHETAHNITLWHCAEGSTRGAKKVGCLQDAISHMWSWRAIARLGLPYTWVGVPSNNNTRSVTGTTLWMTDYGGDAWQIPNDPVTGRMTDQGIVGCGQGSLWPGFESPDDIPDQIERAATVGAVAGAVVGALASAGTSVGVTVVGAVVGAVVGSAVGTAGALIYGAAELTYLATLWPESTADLVVGIDTPLEMGGVLSVCFVANRPADCATKPTIACFSQPPDGVPTCTP